MVGAVYPEVPKQHLPPFSLKAISGKTYTDSDFKEKTILGIVFMSNHCRISQKFQNHIIDITKKYKNDVTIIAVSPNYENAILPDELAHSDLGDSFEEMTKRANRMKYNFLYLYDGEKQKLTKAVGAKITPTIYLYDKNRELFYVGRIGNIDSPDKMETSEVNRVLNNYLNNNKVPFYRTKVYGTSIKTKNHLVLAEQVRKRYSNESVKLNYADSRKLEFYLTHNIHKPKLFYVWQINDKESRENLIKLSFLYKIFRKRGLKVITVCIGKENETDKIIDFLKNSQLSATNFLAYGHHISPLASIIPDKIEKVTPYYRLLSSEGEKLIGNQGVVPIDLLRREILQALNNSN